MQAPKKAPAKKDDGRADAKPAEPAPVQTDVMDLAPGEKTTGVITPRMTGTLPSRTRT